MAVMSVRSTYSLDSETARTIKRLAQSWGASQAEVIRRSVKLAAEQAAVPPMTPVQVIAHYRAAPAARTWPQTHALAGELRAQRRAEDRKRAARRS